jgi:hypothetical protein
LLAEKLAFLRVEQSDEIVGHGETLQGVEWVNALGATRP